MSENNSQLIIIEVIKNNIKLGELFLSNTKNIQSLAESSMFNKEDSIYLDENGTIYLTENKKYFLTFKTSEKFENEEILDNISEQVVLKENFSNKDAVITKKLVLSYQNYVGKTSWRIKYKGKEVFNQIIEIRSSKIDYEKDYQQMIVDLSNFNNGLLYSRNSPVYQLFEMDDTQKEHMKYQYYMYMEYLFAEDNLPFTYNFLIRNLNKKLESYTQRVPIELARNIDLTNITSYISRDNLQHNTTYSHLPEYVPLKVDNIQHYKTINTPENQFFKYFLELVNNILEELLMLFDRGYPKERLNIFKQITSDYLSNIKFNEIQNLDYLPLNSQVLQKKEGYKELLSYYFKLENTYNTVWEDLNNLIKADEKRIFDLYERWCYIQLLKVLEHITQQKVKHEDVFTLNKTSQIYDIQTGFNKNKIRFECSDKFSKPVTIELWYNKLFNGTKEYRDYSSYTVNLKPDYTIKIEYDNTFKLVHFDAKYKKELFKEEEQDKNSDHTQADIAKMHAYYDGIRNTVAAYILYPGTSPDLYYKVKDTISTVGSFSLIPNNQDNIEDLEKYLKCLISNIINQ